MPRNPFLTTPTVLTREWGTETIVAVTPTYMAKLLQMRGGSKGGFQYHVKQESHYLLAGVLRLRIGRADGTIVEHHLTAGAAWSLPPGVPHQEEALADCTILECADPIVDDRVRVDAAYGLSSASGLPSMTSDEAIAKLETFSGDLWRCMNRVDDQIEHIRHHGLADR